MSDSTAASEAIRVLNRYFRMLDDRSFETDRFAEVFAEDGFILRPNGTTMVGPDEIVASHRTSFTRFGATQHLLTGHDVEPENDGLKVRANLVAIHLWGENPGGVINGSDDYFIAGAVITASVAETPSGWRITRLVNTNVWKGGSGFASMAGTPGGLPGGH